jgi:hypothetical protein
LETLISSLLLFGSNSHQEFGLNFHVSKLEKDYLDLQVTVLLPYPLQVDSLGQQGSGINYRAR